jgi:hypothetical protein
MSGKEGLITMRFSLRRRRSTGRHAPIGERTVELVDARNHEVHLLTQDALADGMKTAAGDYVALCGIKVIAASMLVPANRKRCVACRERTIGFPVQRTRKATVSAAAASVATFALSRVDGRVHRLAALESSRVGLEGSGTAACGQRVHTRELSARPDPTQEGLCRPCWGLLPTS